MRGLHMVFISLLATFTLTAAAGQIDRYGRDSYPSGFKPSGACAELVRAMHEELDLPIDEFPKASLPEQIRRLHVLAEAGARNPGISLGGAEEHRLFKRIDVLLARDVKDLGEYSTELRVIADKLAFLLKAGNKTPFLLETLERFCLMTLALPTKDISLADHVARTGAWTTRTRARLPLNSMLTDEEKASDAEGLLFSTMEVLDDIRDTRRSASPSEVLLPFELLRLLINEQAGFSEPDRSHLLEGLVAVMELALPVASALIAESEGASVRTDLLDLLKKTLPHPGMEALPAVYFKLARLRRQLQAQ